VIAAQLPDDFEAQIKYEAIMKPFTIRRGRLRLTQMEFIHTRPTVMYIVRTYRRLVPVALSYSVAHKQTIRH
jgi:hypothetical protein